MHTSLRLHLARPPERPHWTRDGARACSDWLTGASLLLGCYHGDHYHPETDGERRTGGSDRRPDRHDVGDRRLFHLKAGAVRPNHLTVKHLDT